MAIAALRTPIGQIGLEEENGAIVRMHWSARDDGPASPLLCEGLRQLQGYFDGTLTAFDLPLRPAGGPLHQRVFAAMREIPFGQTVTYGDIARDLGLAAAQPVGQACGANPIPILIPCHRVLAANGLGGFSGAGGVEMKIALLQHENAYPYLL